MLRSILRAPAAKAMGFLLPVLLAATLVQAQVKFAVTSISNSFDQSGGDSIQAGDFNNDGILDLVTVNDGGVAFYKGLGGGTYASPVQQTFAFGSEMTAVTAPYGADFNGDGKLDIAVVIEGNCCANAQLFILLGNGDGTFTQGQTIAVNGNYASIALADFNGDHKPDIVLSAFDTRIYVGNGDGTFSLASTAPYAGPLFALGDFNADGKQDLIIPAWSNNANAFALFLGNGDGTLAAPVFTPMPCCNVLDFAVGDLYNNRVQSAAVALLNFKTNYGYIYPMRYSNGAMVLGSPIPLGNLTTRLALSIAAGDLNGDFISDLFVAVQNPASSLYLLGNGNGTFQKPTRTATNGSYGFEQPLIRDLNLDSRHDIAMPWLYLSPNPGGIEQLLNLNATANCAPPAASKLGVNICGLNNGQVVPDTFTFKAAGNAFSGEVKRMELWIDGQKVGENLEDQLNVTATLTSGSHTASFVAVDSFDSTASISRTFTSQ